MWTGPDPDPRADVMIEMSLNRQSYARTTRRRAGGWTDGRSGGRSGAGARADLEKLLEDEQAGLGDVALGVTESPHLLAVPESARPPTPTHPHAPVPALACKRTHARTHARTHDRVHDELEVLGRDHEKRLEAVLVDRAQQFEEVDPVLGVVFEVPVWPLLHNIGHD